MASLRLTNRVLDLWKAKQPAVTAWMGIGSSLTAEALARQGFDACLVDMQHGMIDEGTAIQMFAAIATVPGVTPLARVRCNQPDKIHFLLDAGALGIVCPLINTAQEVRDFVAACRYPPQGRRSYGLGRGAFASSNYLGEANASIATLAMIETKEAIDNLDEICAVEGLDGVFIGPNDLALSIGLPPSSDPTNTEVLRVIENIRNAAHKAGKVAGIFCGNGETAGTMIGRGFDFVCPGWDLGYLMGQAGSELARARAGGGVVESGRKGGREGKRKREGRREEEGRMEGRARKGGGEG